MPAAADPVTSGETQRKKLRRRLDPRRPRRMPRGDANVIVEEASDPAAKNADPTEPTKKKKKKKKKKAAPEPVQGDYFDFKAAPEKSAAPPRAGRSTGRASCKLKVKWKSNRRSRQEKTISISAPGDHLSKPFMKTVTKPFQVRDRWNQKLRGESTEGGRSPRGGSLREQSQKFCCQTSANQGC